MDEANNTLSNEPHKNGECGGANHPCGTCPNSNSEHDDSAEAGMDRGNFIRTAFACVAVGWGGVTLLPILMYLNPPPGSGEEKSKVNSLEVCKLAELPKGTGKNFRFGSVPALVIHTEDGQLHAFKAICTHLGCTVQFKDDKQIIYCACHGGEYDAHTGKNIAGPPPKPLPELKADVVNGTVIVSKV